MTDLTTTDRPPPFRFGATIFSPAGRADWVAKARYAEELGYDVVQLSDRLGMPAPVATLVLAAEATTRIDVGTLVLNTSFYNPPLLARDLATIDDYTGGRLEVGLGAGYDRAQFDAAGLSWTPAPQRVDHLERTLIELRNAFSSGSLTPSVTRSGGPSLLVAGRGERVLRLGVEHADVVALAGTVRVRDGNGLCLGGPAEFHAQLDRVRRCIGGGASPTLHSTLHRVLPPGTAATTDVWGNPLDLGPELLAQLPGVLVGTPAQNAETLRKRRVELGVSYVSVLEPELEAFAPVLQEVRRGEPR